MYFLKDSCAFILSGITLYDGLAINNGIVAFYGNGNVVHSVVKYQTVSSKEELESMLRSSPEAFIERFKFHRGAPNFVTICVPKTDGVKSIERYLESLDFSPSSFNNEKQASSYLFNELKDIPPGSTIDGESISNEISKMGRVIASAVTMGHIGLLGNFGCASIQDNQALYQLRINFPLDMGTLNLKELVESPYVKKALVYINGSLRILSSTGKPQQPINKIIWDIHPKLDATKNYGLMSRKDLDMILYVINDNYLTANGKDKAQHVFLGCFNDSRGD